MKLTDEHIIPYALNGFLVLAGSSCLECNTITSKFERKSIRSAFETFRIVSGSASRRASKRPKDVSIKRTNAKRKKSNPKDWQDVEVDRRLFPRGGGWFLPNYGDAGILKGIPPWENDDWKFTSSISQDDMNGLLSLGKNHAMAYSVDGDAFARMLAKIAHSFVIALVGPKNFKPFLNRFILNHDKSINHFLETTNRADHDYILHRIGLDPIGLPNGKIGAHVRVCLFEAYGTPTYGVIAGELSQGALDDVPERGFNLPAVRNA